MTNVVCNTYYSKFVDRLFKFKSPGEYFTIKEIQDHLMKDRNSLSDKQALQYIGELLKLGRVVDCGSDKYQILELKTTEQNEKPLYFIDYIEFCNKILGWKLKGEMTTVKEITPHLNKLNIFIKYFLIREYIDKMVDEGKMIRYNKYRYQIVQ